MMPGQEQIKIANQPPTSANGELRRSLHRSWEENGRVWAQAIADKTIDSRVQVTDVAIVAAIRTLRPRRVLDLGCGEGWLCRQLTAAGIAVTGVDASEALLSVARGYGLTSCQCADYGALTADPRLCPGPFDVAVFNFALLDDQGLVALRAAAQRLDKGGHVLIQTLHPLAAGPPYRDGWREERFEAFSTADWTPMPWYFRTLTSWLNLFNDGGFLVRSLDEPASDDATRPPASVIFRLQKTTDQFR